MFSELCSTLPSSANTTSIKLQINILTYHLPVSCVGGPQRKPLRWRVVRTNPCHTGAQCGARPTRAGHGRAVQNCTGATSRGRGQPPQHQLPLNGSDGQRRRGGGSAPTATGTRLWLASPDPAWSSPGQPPLCQGTRSPRPHAPGGEGSCLVALVEGGYLRTVPGPPRSYLRGPAVGPSPSPSSQPLQPASPRTPPPAEAAAPGLRSPGRRGRVGLACDTGEVWR